MKLGNGQWKSTAKQEEQGLKSLGSHCMLGPRQTLKNLVKYGVLYKNSEEGSDFYLAKVFIKTSHFSFIEQWITFLVEGVAYDVYVEEFCMDLLGVSFSDNPKQSVHGKL